jgi:hypothetical protein
MKSIYATFRSAASGSILPFDLIAVFSPCSRDRGENMHAASTTYGLKIPLSGTPQDRSESLEKLALQPQVIIQNFDNGVEVGYTFTPTSSS